MVNLGRVGVWSTELRFGDKAEAAAAASELDSLGYGALWVPGGIGGPVLQDLDDLLSATSRATIATGILNVWKHDPAEVAGWFLALPADRQARVMLGLGISHGPLIGEEWKRPVAAMRAYLDKLEAAGMPRDNLCLAALGPKMLELSGERTAGAHPYLVNPAHTAEARGILGPGKLLAPEQGVVLESDPARAREMAVEALVHYRRLPNYVNNWKRLGFTDEEIENVSDRFIDAIFACGDAAAIAARVAEHHAAGADHVCVQAITGGAGLAKAMPALRELARVLL